MVLKPLPRLVGGLLQGPGLFEEVSGARYDHELRLAFELRLGGSVESEDDMVLPSDDEECRCTHQTQSSVREVGATTARNDGGDRR